MIPIAQNLVDVRRQLIDVSGKLYDPYLPDDDFGPGDGLGRSEFAGPRFSPDGTWLFVNIQVPGITCAITGDWESIGSVSDGPTRELPRIVATPPGPKTRDILERQSAVLYRGLAEEVGPFVICRKSGYEIEDVDGNVYLDCISAMASVPAGAARADITEAAVEALRRYGNEDTHYYSHEYVLPLAERLVAIAPGDLPARRHRAERHRGGRDRRALHAARHRAPDRDRVHGRLPREAGTAGAIGAETSDLSYGYRALMPGFVHVPYRTRTARRSSRDPAARATARWTTCATTCCTTRSTRARSPGS